MKVEKIPLLEHRGVRVVDTGVPVVSFEWDGPYIRLKGQTLLTPDEVRELAKELLEWLAE